MSGRRYCGDKKQQRLHFKFQLEENERGIERFHFNYHNERNSGAAQPASDTSRSLHFLLSNTNSNSLKLRGMAWRGALSVFPLSFE